MQETSPLKQLWEYAESERKNVIVASVYTIINKFFDIFPEILLGIAIDVVARKNESFVAGLGFESTKAQLVFLAVLTFLINGNSCSAEQYSRLKQTCSWKERQSDHRLMYEFDRGSSSSSHLSCSQYLSDFPDL